MQHILFIVLDSCRYDSLVTARTPNIDRIGVVQKRYSYASWTAPSHYTFAMGMMPHASPTEVFASEIYQEEYAQWRERTGHPELDFKRFLPEFSLPKVLGQLGYRTVAKVSMPVLNPHTLLRQHFDDYELRPHHNDFAGMIAELEFPAEQPHFYLLNLGETHYPYMLSGDDLPRVSGVHGVLAASDAERTSTLGVKQLFSTERFAMLHRQQSLAVEYVDGLIGTVMQRAPRNTHFIVTADHGELFGEDGYFGHGPIMHEKCFEVPFVEGVVS